MFFIVFFLFFIKCAWGQKLSIEDRGEKLGRYEVCLELFGKYNHLSDIRWAYYHHEREYSKLGGRDRATMNAYRKLAYQTALYSDNLNEQDCLKINRNIERTQAFLDKPIHKKRISKQKSNKTLVKPKTYIKNKKEYYRVRTGDSIYKIASTFNTTVKKIITINNFKNQHVIHPGDEIVIPRPTSTSKDTSKKQHNKSRKKQFVITYRVKKDDTLNSIAKRFKVNKNDILAWNKKITNEKITEGESIRLTVSYN